MISVVIPAFNEEKYISDCLESLAQQDFRGEYEVIVVDNGCSDGTQKIAESLGARVVSCPVKGVINARETGAASARGEIIVQADADTVYPGDWLSKIQAHFNADGRIVAVSGFFYYKEPPAWARVEYFTRKAINRLFGLPFLGHPYMVSGANFAFRKDAFTRIGGYHHDSLYPDQWGICRSLKAVGRIKYDTSIVAYTSHRRVDKKPFLRMVGDAIKNLQGVIKYFFRHLFRCFASVFKKKPGLKARMIAISLLFTALAGYLVYGYAVPSSQAFGQLYSSSKTTEKVIALTFDDGPNEPYTSEILDILKKYGAKATFFVVGKNAELYPEVTKRILLEGNVLGNHSYSHNANHALYDDGGFEIRKTQEVIKKIAGVEPHIYRPPHGKKSPWEMACIRNMNIEEVTWNNAVNDQHNILVFGKPRPDKMAISFVDKAKPGDIILMHDGFGTEHNNERANKECTVRLLPMVIEKLQTKGYSFVTIPVLLSIQDYN